jgi:fatty-acid desaturase
MQFVLRLVGPVMHRNVAGKRIWEAKNDSTFYKPTNRTKQGDESHNHHHSFQSGMK